MVGLGLLMILLSGLAFWHRNHIENKTRLLKLLVLAIPLPYIANQAGWVLAEVGRQPWIVYGVMKTSQSVSPVATSQVLPSLIAFILVYGMLGAVGLFLVIKAIQKGPQPLQAG